MYLRSEPMVRASGGGIGQAATSSEAIERTKGKKGGMTDMINESYNINDFSKTELVVRQLLAPLQEINATHTDVSEHNSIPSSKCSRRASQAQYGKACAKRERIG